MFLIPGLTLNDALEIILLVGLLILLLPIVGAWMASAFRQGRSWMFKPGMAIENVLYKVAGINPTEEMSWKTYLVCVVWLHALGLVALTLQLMFQGALPLNPDAAANLDFGLALNIATSFVTNTNWQVYAGETTLSQLSQMMGLGVQNFLSAAAGLAVLVCLARCLRRKLSSTVGNFWVDMTRSILYLLLPVSLIFGLFLSQQGVPQSFGPKIEAKTVEGGSQTIYRGPIASQVAIKIVGSNGGGYFNANSSHPFENPTPATNFISILLILLIPGACLFLFGGLIDDKRHAWALLGAVLSLFLGLLALGVMAQVGENHAIFGLPFLEGTETRFGAPNSVLWNVATTVTSNGSINANPSSLSPLAGFANLFGMLLGEIVFGGVGCGTYGLILFAILTVFLAGLMVGRTPEYLGKKIQAPEVVLASIGVLAPGIVILLMAGLGAVLPKALEAIRHGGPHGLSEILYAFTSTAQNNGSAFGALDSTNSFYLWSTTFTMLAGRFFVMVPVIVLSGLFAAKKVTPPSAGTFPTNGLTFSLLLLGVIFLVGALTFFPVLSLGPILEHLLMLQGRVFAP